MFKEFQAKSNTALTHWPIGRVISDIHPSQNNMFCCSQFVWQCQQQNWSIRFTLDINVQTADNVRTLFLPMSKADSSETRRAGGVEEVGGGCLVERFQTGSVRCCCFPSNQLWYLLVHYKWVHPKRALFKDSCHHCGMLACIVNILNPHNGGGDSGAFTWLDLGSHLSAACPSYHSSVDTRVLLLLLPSPAALIW